MATGTNGIATRANANSIASGSYSSDLNRCITYESAIATGKLTVNNASKYTSNTKRLVLYSDLVKKATPLTLKFRLYANKCVAFFAESNYYLTGLSLTIGSNTLSLILADAKIYGTVDSAGTSGYITFTLSTIRDSTSSNTYVLDTRNAQLFIDDGNDNRLDLAILGDIRFGVSALDSQRNSITVTSGTQYFSNAYLVETAFDPIVPDPSTSTTYTVRLRIKLTDIAVYQFRIGIGSWNITGTAGITLGRGTMNATAYRPTELPMDIDRYDNTNGGGWYVIELWSGTTRPVYINPGVISFGHRANNIQSWMVGTYTIKNTINAYYGYALNEGYSSTLFNFDLECSGGLRV